MANEFIPPRKNKTGILSAAGILLLVLGAGYLFSLSFNLGKQIDEKEKTLAVFEEKLLSKNDSIKLLDSIIARKKAAFNEVITAVSENNEKKVDSIVSSTTTTENILKNKLKTEQLQTQKQLNNDPIPQMQQQVRAKPPVYIQVGDKETLAALTKMRLKEILNKKGYDASGYEVITTDWKQNTVRYFHKEDERAAGKLKLEIEKMAGLKLELLYVKGYEEKVDPGQMELWIKIESRQALKK